MLEVVGLAPEHDAFGLRAGAAGGRQNRQRGRSLPRSLTVILTLDERVLGIVA